MLDSLSSDCGCTSQVPLRVASKLPKNCIFAKETHLISLTVKTRMSPFSLQLLLPTLVQARMFAKPRNEHSH